MDTSPQPFDLIFLEVLRVGLIAIRNLAFSEKNGPSFPDMKREWASLCHSIPPILLGRCSDKAVRYFREGDGKMFLENYPRKEDADYRQIAQLLKELDDVLGEDEM